MTQIVNTWHYGQVKSNALNVRREPSRKARRWNNVWPMNRLVLVKPSGVDGWYETLYRGEPAYVMAEFIKLLNAPVPSSIVERMMFIAEPEKGRNKSIYFNGYGGKWCHRFASAAVQRWLDEGADLNAKLPFLRAYMGHASFSQTAYYIHLLPANLTASNAVDWSAFDALIPEV